MDYTLCREIAAECTFSSRGAAAGDE